MNIRPQDVVVALVVALSPEETRSFPALAHAAGLSLSEAHASVKRATQAGLLTRSVDDGALMSVRESLLEFLVHGVKYAFPAERGRITRGVPTAHSAPVLAAQIAGAEDKPLVWPCATGGVRGESLAPLYRTVTDVALANPKLYDALALVDAIRAGNARERALSAELLEQHLMEAPE